MKFEKGKKVRVVGNKGDHGYKLSKEITMDVKWDEIGFRAKERPYYWVMFSDCEEITPTLEEVKEYFKDAKEVRSLYKNTRLDKEINTNEFNFFNGSWWLLNTLNNDCEIWNSKDGYAEIVSYKDKESAADLYREFHGISNKPTHYAKGIDTFERMEKNCTKEECLAFAKGNIDKYNWRTKGQDKEDFEKIINYANWALKILDEKV